MKKKTELVLAILAAVCITWIVAVLLLILWGAINWPWWVAFLPLFVPLGVSMLYYLAMCIYGIIIAIYEAITHKSVL